MFSINKILNMTVIIYSAFRVLNYELNGLILNVDVSYRLTDRLLGIIYIIFDETLKSFFKTF